MSNRTRPMDLERKKMKRHCKEKIKSLEKCKPKIASKVGERAGLKDPRSATKYVKDAAKKVEGATITKTSRFTLVHRDPPGTQLDPDCLRTCAENIYGFSNSIGISSEETIEKLLADFCRCKCQIKDSD